MAIHCVSHFITEIPSPTQNGIRWWGSRARESIVNNWVSITPRFIRNGRICLASISEWNRYAWKLLGFDENTWNYITVYKLFVLWIITWTYICLKKIIVRIMKFQFLAEFPVNHRPHSVLLVFVFIVTLWSISPNNPHFPRIMFFFYDRMSWFY